MEPDYSGMGAPPFTLRQFAYLIAAAETGTIVGAAEKLHVSPSAMSDAITELERLIGTRLCVRRKAQGLTLTSAGVRAVADARRLLRDANELYVALHADEDELVGPLAVGCFPTLAPTVLPLLLSEFGATHPRLDIEVIEADQDDLVALLDSGRIDVAFVYDVDLPGSPRRSTLFRLPPHIIISAQHRLAGEEVIRLEDVIDEDFIMLDSSPSSEHALSLFSENGLTPRVRHRTGNPDVVRSLVGRGLGYGMLIQRYTDYSFMRNYPVVIKEISPAVSPVAVDVIWSSAIPPTPRTTAVIEFAQGATWPSSTDG